MFGAEWIFGGTTNTQTLHHLGALEPDAVIRQHEYWRLLTALFLHYGAAPYSRLISTPSTCSVRSWNE